MGASVTFTSTFREHFSDANADGIAILSRGHQRLSTYHVMFKIICNPHNHGAAAFQRRVTWTNTESQYRRTSHGFKADERRNYAECVHINRNCKITGLQHQHGGLTPAAQRVRSRPCVAESNLVKDAAYPCNDRR